MLCTPTDQCQARSSLCQLLPSRNRNRYPERRCNYHGTWSSAVRSWLFRQWHRQRRVCAARQSKVARRRPACSTGLLSSVQPRQWLQPALQRNSNDLRPNPADRWMRLHVKTCDLSPRWPRSSKWWPLHKWHHPPHCRRGSHPLPAHVTGADELMTVRYRQIRVVNRLPRHNSRRLHPQLSRRSIPCR